MRRTQWLTYGCVCALLLAMLVAACAPAAAPTPTPTKPPAATPATQASPKSSPAAQSSTPVPPAATPKPVTVRFGSPASVSDGGIYVAMERGYFKEQGIDIQWTNFKSLAEMIPLLTSGDLDIAGATIATALLNAIDRGLSLKVVASKGSIRPGFEFTRVTARKDLVDSGQLKDAKDMKGKKIAAACNQCGSEAMAASILRQAGLTIKDVDYSVMGFPDMVVAYGNKGIDLAVQIEPTLTAGVENGLAVRWAPGTISTAYGGEEQVALLTASEAFTKNQDAAGRFMVAYLKGVRDYNDAFVKGKDRSGMIAILAKYTSLKDLDKYASMEMPYLDPDGKLNLDSMKKDLDYFKEMGYYTGKLSLDSILDTQFIQYASQQLGPYK